MKVKIYEIRCRDCGARFNLPNEYSEQHSNVIKLVPKGFVLLEEYAKDTDKSAIYRETATTSECLEYDEAQEKLVWKPCTKKHFKTHQLIKDDTKFVIYANKDDSEIETLENKKRIILKDLDHIDVDGSYCFNFTIEVDDFDEIPMRANVTTQKLPDGRTEYLFTCTECGAEAIKIVR